MSTAEDAAKGNAPAPAGEPAKPDGDRISALEAGMMKLAQAVNDLAAKFPAKEEKKEDPEKPVPPEEDEKAKEMSVQYAKAIARMDAIERSLANPSRQGTPGQDVPKDPVARLGNADFGKVYLVREAIREGRLAQGADGKWHEVAQKGRY